MASLASTSAFPAGRGLKAYTVQVVRAAGSNYAESPVIMPAGFTPVNLRVLSAAVSNAGTNARLSIGSSGYASTDFVADYDVKGSGATTQAIPSSAALLGAPLPFDTRLCATYIEAGTPSTSGGPWSVVVEGFNVG